MRLFDRTFGLVKNTLYKTVGKPELEWKELEEVLADIEATLNNRPLTYIEEDIQFPFYSIHILQILKKKKIYERDQSIHKDARKQHVSDGEMNILHN